MKYINASYSEFLRNLGNKKVILFGAGAIAKQFVSSLEVLIRLETSHDMASIKMKDFIKDYQTKKVEDIVAFCVDNDVRRHNTVWDMGNKQFFIYSTNKLAEMERLEENYKLVITSRYFPEIFIQLSHIEALKNVECYIAPIMCEDKGNPFWDELFTDKIYRDNILNYKENLKNLKDIHKGKRCFIIGNGPSLRAEDLDMLKDEITFAVNRIYLYYNKTEWRPTYYGVIDDKHLSNSTDGIRSVQAEKKFIPMYILRDIKKEIEGATYFDFDTSKFYPEPPNFSADVSDRVYEGMTVTYALLQIACYMGFKKIYLLGLDHSYSRECLPDGTIKINEGVVNYFQENYAKSDDNPARIQHMDLAYSKARVYGEQNGIEIYNATRGGKLEVFKRVDFDTLF